MKWRLLLASVALVVGVITVAATVVAWQAAQRTNWYPDPGTPRPTTPVFRSYP